MWKGYISHLFCKFYKLCFSHFAVEYYLFVYAYNCLGLLSLACLLKADCLLLFLFSPQKWLEGWEACSELGSR